MEPVGSCSICGGTVYRPTGWLGLTPALATCSSCGAREASRLPVIPMVPCRPTVVPNTSPFTTPSVPHWVGDIPPWTTIFISTS